MSRIGRASHQSDPLTYVMSARSWWGTPPACMNSKMCQRDTWNSRTSDKILLMISCSVPPHH